MPDMTSLLEAAAAGDARASAELLPLVYEELRKLAAARLEKEKPGQTLQATALVHEAYLRLIGPNQGSSWNGRGHFFAAAAEAMRRILVESARRKGRVKRGGRVERVDLDDVVTRTETPPDEFLSLNDALDRLSVAAPRAAELVKLRFFAGLTRDQSAAILNISPRTADATWAYARAWLFDHLNG